MELGQKLLQLYSSTPIGSFLVCLMSLIFTIFFNTSLGVSVWDAINPLKILFFSFSHESWWHFVVGVLVFPLAANKFEKEKGTLYFLYSFFFLQVLLGQLFIWTMKLLQVLSLFTWNMDEIKVSGLDLMFMVFITIEAMDLNSDLNTIEPRESQVPKFMYPVGFMFLLELVLWDFLCTRHAVGIILGYLYAQKVFFGLFPSPFTLGNLESVKVLQPVVKSNIYVPIPGAISLETAETSTRQGAKSGSFLDQVRGFVGNSSNSQYVKIEQGQMENGLLEKDQLWDDLDEPPEDWDENSSEAKI